MTSSVINEINDVFVGEYGEPIILHLLDDDGNAVDVSSYTGTKTAYLRTPDALKTVQATVTFTNTGVDGLVQFTPASGDIDRPGDWEGQVELQKTSVKRYTWPFTMHVGKRVA